MTDNEKKAKIEEIWKSDLPEQQRLLAIEKFLEEADKPEEPKEPVELKVPKEPEPKEPSVTKVEVVGAEQIAITGKDGKQGVQGLPGKDGLDGTDGKDGLPGIPGKDGTDGKDGEPGKDGIDGKDGLPAEKGADGSPDTALEIKNKLESLVKDERLSASAIKGLDDLTDKITHHVVTNAKGLLFAGLVDGGGSGGVTASIGGVITGGTAGSVLFVNPSGVIAQDNANFFWDDTNNRLGIGTNTPAGSFEIRAGATANDFFRVTSAGNVSGSNNSFGTKWTIILNDGGGTASVRLAANTSLAFNSNNNLNAGATDTALVRNAAGQLAVVNMTAGAVVTTFGSLIAGTIYGDTAANGNLILEATSNATKTTSYLILQPTVGNVGIGTSAPAQRLDVVGQTILVGADVASMFTRTDATSKTGRFFVAHYTNAEEPGFMIGMATSSTGNIISIGGSSAGGNAATQIDFYTAANNTTTSGTLRWLISTAGVLGAGTDNVYDIGLAGSFRPRSIYAGTSVFAGSNIQAQAGIYTNSGSNYAGISNWTSKKLGFLSDWNIAWKSTATGDGTSVTGDDTNLSRIAAGVLGVGTGAQGSIVGTMVAARFSIGGTGAGVPSISRSGAILLARLADDSAAAQFIAATLGTTITTVAGLPGTPYDGMRASVSDSNAASFTAGIGTVVAGGGTLHVPVYYDGTNWRIG